MTKYKAHTTYNIQRGNKDMQRGGGGWGRGGSSMYPMLVLLCENDL